MNDGESTDVRIAAIPDVHGHAKGEHKSYAEERPIALSARMLFLWFFHACRRGSPRFMMVADHMNYLTFEDPAAVNLVRRALKLAAAGDLYGAAETANVDVAHAAVVSEGLRRGMRYSLGAEVDNDPRSRPDAQNIVDAMKPDGIIRSVHFLPIDHPVHGPNWNWPFDNPEFAEFYDTVGTEQVWEIYMRTLLDAVERLPGHIVGHFYVPAKFGHWPSDEILEGHEDRFVAAVAERGMAIEFNTRFLYRSDDEEQRERYKAANLRLLRKAKAAGVPIAVGSDAHSPKDQGGAFEEVLAVLDEAEINELVFPIAGRLARVALRIVRPAEDEAAASEPAPALAGAESAQTQPARATEAAPGPPAAATETSSVPEATAAADGRQEEPAAAAAERAEPAARSAALPDEAAAAAAPAGAKISSPKRARPRRPSRARTEGPAKPPLVPEIAVPAPADQPAASTAERSPARKKTTPVRKAAASSKAVTSRSRPSAKARPASKATSASSAKKSRSAGAAKKTSSAAARRSTAKPAAKKAVAKKSTPSRTVARKPAPKPPRPKSSAPKSAAKSAKKSVAKKTAAKKPAAKRRTRSS